MVVSAYTILAERQRGTGSRRILDAGLASRASVTRQDPQNRDLRVRRTDRRIGHAAVGIVSEFEVAVAVERDLIGPTFGIAGECTVGLEIELFAGRPRRE